MNGPLYLRPDKHIESVYPGELDLTTRQVEHHIHGNPDMAELFKFVWRLIDKNEFVRSVSIDVTDKEAAAVMVTVDEEADWIRGNYINPADVKGRLVPFSGFLRGALMRLPDQDDTKLLEDLSLVPPSRRSL